MVRLAQLDATPREDGLGVAIQDRLADLDSGKYRRNNAYALQLFAEWLRHEDSVTEVEAITPQHLRAFARELRTAMETTPDDEYYVEINASSTVNQYYDYVSAWLSWAVRDQYLNRNPARTETATEPLPETSSEPDRQFWSPREREAICATGDQLVDRTLDDQPDKRTKLRVYRNRALVYLLGYSGCRGAEVAAVREDPKRNGLQWKEINLDDGVLTVYGKSREWEQAPLFEPAIGPIQRWQQVLEPPDEEWPVLPTFHLPSLYSLLPDRVEATPESVWDDLRTHEISPSAVTVDGVRRTLASLCEGADYQFDEPLKPHGARRGLGDQLYQEQAELAQDVLRHRSIETTHEAYSEERVRRVKERGDELFE
jgi:integrase